MPPAIQKVANKYLRDASKIHIATKTQTVSSIDQGCVFVSHYNKLEALTRFLETEVCDAIMIFARTKVETTELAEKLSARGYSVDALNGDVKQSMREKVIQRLKNKTLDIVVATEVAARGLDVDRIDLVVNYDIPTDPESYVHRIGRTGRAGRSGKAITFVTPRERGLLGAIERTINTRIAQIQIPSLQQMHEKRVGNLSKKILEILGKENLSIHRELIERIAQESEYNALDIAAALAYMSQGDSLSQPESNDELSKPIHVDRDRDYGRQDGGGRRDYGGGRSGGGDRNRSRSRDGGERSHSRPSSGDRDRGYSRPREDDRRERSNSRPSEERSSRPFASKPSFKKEESKDGAAPRKKRVFDRKAPAGAPRKPRTDR